MTENESQIVEYPFTIFFFPHETSITPSYLPIAYQTIGKLILRWKYFENLYNRGDFYGQKQFTITSENICARKQISITRDWILAGDSIIRGFPNGFYLARSCPIGSLISVNTGRQDYNRDTACVGALKGHMCPRREKNDIVACEIPRTGIGEAYNRRAIGKNK